MGFDGHLLPYVLILTMSRVTLFASKVTLEVLELGLYLGNFWGTQLNPNTTQLRIWLLNHYIYRFNTTPSNLPAM